MKLTSVLVISFLCIVSSAYAIEPGQWDNFEDGTTMGWTSGAPNPNPPVIELDGGPGGEGDAYLLVRSNGGFGAGSMLITFNTSQWTGDYISAGVTVISMHMNNFSDDTLYMRIAVQGSGGNFWSIEPVILTPQSGWQTAQFSLSPDDLTGGSDINATLSNVSPQFRILHSKSGASIGDIVNADLGIDNITAAADPLPVELVSFTAVQNKNNIVLNWVTSSEKNNLGFEIERNIFRNSIEEGWRIIGFKEGRGTAVGQNNYLFTDNIANITGDRIAYRLKQVDFNGTFTYSDVVYVNKITPAGYVLYQNFPNPFNPSTIIKYSVPLVETHSDASLQWIVLKVYDILGNEIAVLVDEEKQPGEYEVEFSAKGGSSSGGNAFSLSSGIYYYHLSAGTFSETKKMILLR